MFAIRTFALVTSLTLINAVQAGCEVGGDQSSDKIVAKQAASLRNQGPAGLEIALAEYDRLAAAVPGDFDPNANGKGHSAKYLAARRAAEQKLQLARQRVDAVAAQRDAVVSRLYWHTDLDEAQQRARESGKPILSLRMLGRLTDEYSCANSRFFRTALYSNRQVSDYLRDNYVLHWQSVRPVPRVTVDFGDGRKLERTITGNSAHYMLSAAGRPLDVLPGLYGPRAFLDWLKQWEFKARELAQTAPASQDDMLVYYHRSALGGLEYDLNRDLAKVAPDQLRQQLVRLGRDDDVSEFLPDAIEAGKQAFAKTAAEAPIVRQVLPDDQKIVVQNDQTWRKIAALHRDEAALDEASVSIMRREHPDAQAAGALATAKREQEDPVLQVIRNFEESIALDTVKNEYLLHRRVHEWFISGKAPENFDALNEKVYAELFLTPSSDPWLGLAPANVYTALDHGGLTADQ